MPGEIGALAAFTVDRVVREVSLALVQFECHSTAEGATVRVSAIRRLAHRAVQEAAPGHSGEGTRPVQRLAVADTSESSAVF